MDTVWSPGRSWKRRARKPSSSRTRNTAQARAKRRASFPKRRCLCGGGASGASVMGARLDVSEPRQLIERRLVARLLGGGLDVLLELLQLGRLRVHLHARIEQVDGRE